MAIFGAAMPPGGSREDLQSDSRRVICDCYSTRNKLSSRLDNGTTLAPRLILRSSVVPIFVAHRCVRLVFLRVAQLHSCAPWAQPCVRGGCGSSKRARVSRSAAGCLNLQLSGSKQAIPVWTCSAWSRSQRRWRSRFGRFCDVRRGASGGLGMARPPRPARAAARRVRGAAADSRKSAPGSMARKSVPGA